MTQLFQMKKLEVFEEFTGKIELCAGDSLKSAGTPSKENKKTASPYRLAVPQNYAAFSINVSLETLRLNLIVK
jgi:hypothetical protein